MYKKSVLLLLVGLFIFFSSNGQDTTSFEDLPSSKIEESESSGKILTPITKPASAFEPMTDREFSLTWWILLFGFCVILLETVIVIWINHSNQIAMKIDKDASATKSKPFIIGPNITKLLGVTMIIISALILITGGFSGEEIAPIVGLLGTVAGYLLGKSSDVRLPETGTTK